LDNPNGSIVLVLVNLQRTGGKSRWWLTQELNFTVPPDSLYNIAVDLLEDVDADLEACIIFPKIAALFGHYRPIALLTLQSFFVLTAKISSLSCDSPTKCLP
jgi:hypothetical protein